MQACASDLVLHTSNWFRQFIMETDTSGFALGVIIMQEYEDGIHTITFHFRSLLPAEKNYDAHDKELTGVVFGFKCGCPYFLGIQHPIIV